MAGDPDPDKKQQVRSCKFTGDKSGFLPEKGGHNQESSVVHASHAIKGLHTLHDVPHLASTQAESQGGYSG